MAACTAPTVTQTVTVTSTTTPTATPTVTITSTTTSTVTVTSTATETTTELISVEPPMGIEIANGYEIEHIFRPALVGPGDVDIGPNGDIYVTEWKSHRAARVSNDGTVSTYFEAEFLIEALAFNSAGELFSFDGENIIKISPTGEMSIFASNIPFGEMAFDLQDNLYGLSDGELIRFTPDGIRSVLATDVPSGHLAVSPSGEVYIANWQEGKIFKVDSGGTITTLTGGFFLDPFAIAFDKEGNLYTNQTYFVRVSLEDGSLSAPILRDYNILINCRPFAFDPSGDVIFVGPTSNTVVKASLDGQRISCLVEGIGNSHALTVGPSGDLFMGASNAYPIDPGKVVRVSADGSVSDFISGFTTIRDITFDTLGNMYVSDWDAEGGTGGRLLKISPEGGINTILSGHYDLHSIVFDQASGDILGFEQNGSKIMRITREGNTEILPIDFGGDVRVADLASDQQDNLITLVAFEENYDIGPVHRGLFRITPDNKVTLITNIDTPLASSEDDIFVHPSGDIFVVGPEEHPNFRLLRITPHGNISVVARMLPFDTLSLTINQEGEIFFTCSAGLFKVSENGSN